MAAWPPAPFDVALRQLDIYDALYSNDMGRVPYMGGSPATHTHRGAPYSGGLVGKMSSTVWGTPTSQNTSQLSIPVPGDLAQLSADLLFAEECKITLPGARAADAPEELKKLQARLDLIVSSDEAHAELLRSGEYAAAHGGTYLAIVWDKTIADHVWFRAYRADCAIPEFRGGRLAAVTLWTDYQREDDVYRLLERHEPGLITYSLWKGEANTKGNQVPLDTITETEHYLRIYDVRDEDRVALPEAETLDSVVKTGVEWITVEYYPNMLPNPMWDKKGVLANLGRSDFFGLEPLFERINGLWSSLMRDFDNGMGRLTVPESYLKLKGPGQGAEFDMSRQVYSPVGGLVDDGKGGTITISQFKIRVTEHLDAIVALKREIAMAAGYSVSHFGIHDGGGTKTATEVTADFKDSERTRDKKALYVRPALSRLARTALAIDALVFPNGGGAVTNDLPDIEFAEVSQVDPEARARTVSLLTNARAMSIKTAVRESQPNLDDPQIDEEVEQIRLDYNLGDSTDPSTFTG
jgi:A118 family predicted phage portal protein